MSGIDFYTSSVGFCAQNAKKKKSKSSSPGLQLAANVRASSSQNRLLYRSCSVKYSARLKFPIIRQVYRDSRRGDIKQSSYPGKVYEHIQRNSHNV